MSEWLDILVANSPWIILLLLCWLNWLDDREKSRIKSGEDLMQRYVVFAHRKDRKAKGLPYLM